MTRTSVHRLIALAALVAASVSCGDASRNSQSPVYLVMDELLAAQGNHPATLSGFLNSDVITNVTTPAPCTPAAPCPTVFNDVGQAKLRIVVKDIGTPILPNNPSTNNEVTINRVHISYRRADGRNTPGVDVPYAFDGAVTGTVAVGGQLTLAFEIVRHAAKEESPLVQLKTSDTIITTIVDVTFYGSDRVGHAVSVTGSIQIDFANFGDS